MVQLTPHAVKSNIQSSKDWRSLIPRLYVHIQYARLQQNNYTNFLFLSDQHI